MCVIKWHKKLWNPEEPGQFTYAASIHEFYIPGTFTKAQHSPAWSSSHTKWHESSYDISIEIYFDCWNQNTILQYSKYKYPCWTRHIHKRLNSLLHERFTKLVLGQQKGLQVSKIEALFLLGLTLIFPYSFIRNLYFPLSTNTGSHFVLIGIKRL